MTIRSYLRLSAFICGCLSLGFAQMQVESITTLPKSISVLISPDGKKVALRNPDGSKLLDLDTMTTRALAHLIPLTFSADSESLYGEQQIDQKTWKFVRLPLSGEQAAIPVGLPPGFAISHDGKRIAYLRSEQYQTPGGIAVGYLVMVADIDGKNETQLASFRYPENANSPFWSPDDRQVLLLTSSGRPPREKTKLWRISPGSAAKAEELCDCEAHSAIAPRDQGGLFLLHVDRQFQSWRQDSIWHYDLTTRAWTRLDVESPGDNGMYHYSSLSAGAGALVANREKFTPGFWNGLMSTLFGLDPLVAERQQIEWDTVLIRLRGRGTTDEHR